MADRGRPPALPTSGGRVVMGLDVEPMPTVTSIGFFDGVHRGHQTIISRAARHAHLNGMRSAVITFDRHPMEVVKPGSQPRLLMTLERRAHTLATAGVDLVIVVPFDDELRHLSPAEFVERVVVSRLGTRRVVVGTNFRFGHRAAGDLATLAELGPSYGFEAEGVGLLELGGVVVSSTEIRSAVDAGDVAQAAVMLGRPHIVDGVVVRGNQRGATLGFPTANVKVDQRVALPARGVYAGLFYAGDDDRHQAAVNVGVNPTFAGQELRVEAYLLDFAGDLYGASVAVDFRHRLRDEQRFDSVEDLVAAMHADVERTRRVLEGDPPG